MFIMREITNRSAPYLDSFVSKLRMLWLSLDGTGISTKEVSTEKVRYLSALAVLFSFSGSSGVGQGHGGQRLVDSPSDSSRM